MHQYRFQLSELTKNSYIKGAASHMKINDEYLERLGIYFTSMEIYKTYGVTFEHFVERNQRGTWEL